jgi:hypothetical protein
LFRLLICLGVIPADPVSTYTSFQCQEPLKLEMFGPHDSFALTYYFATFDRLDRRGHLLGEYRKVRSISYEVVSSMRNVAISNNSPSALRSTRILHFRCAWIYCSNIPSLSRESDIGRSVIQSEYGRGLE